MLKNSFKTMVLKSLVLVGFLSVTGLAQSAQDIWIIGLGDGNLEYFITNQTAQLHISCPTTSSLPETKSNVALIIDGKQGKRPALPSCKQFLVLQNYTFST